MFRIIVLAFAIVKSEGESFWELAMADNKVYNISYIAHLTHKVSKSIKSIANREDFSRLVKKC